jgi:hypothetical protein
MTPAFPAIQATHAFSITPSDTVDVKDDTANPDDALHVFLHNPGAGVTVRVLPAGMSTDDTPVTVYIAQGATLPLAVRRVYATTPTTAAGAFIGFYSKQR